MNSARLACTEARCGNRCQDYGSLSMQTLAGQIDAYSN